MLLKTLVFTFVALQAVAQPGWLWFPPQPQPGSFPFPQPQPGPYPQPGPQSSSWPFPHPHPGPYPQPMPFPMPGPYPRPGPYPQPQPIPFPFPGPQPFPEPGSFPPETESFPFPPGTGFPGPFPRPKPFPGPFPGPEPFPPRTGSLPEPEAFPGPQLKPDPRRNPQPMPSPKDPASPCNNNVEYFCQRLDKEVSRELRAKGFKEEFNAAKAAAFTGVNPASSVLMNVWRNSIMDTKSVEVSLREDWRRWESAPLTVSKDSMTIDIRHHIAEYTLSVPVPSMKFEIDVIKKKFADCSTNIQEFVKGYFEIVDFEERFRSEDLQVVYDEILEWKLQSKASIIGKFDMEIDLPTWTPFETHNSAKMVEELSRSMFTGAYVNLLVAKAFHKKNQTQFIHDPERVARLKKMAQTILDEMKLQIDETEWISEESKKKLKNMHTVDDFLFGPPKTFLDAEMVDKALKIFKQFFKKAKANEGEMIE
ncbi:hypothetical protein L596_001100 [Steinernema carpocapsae]|uniref:Peptidase M13 N-terminal domain-containing protein n=1 Tax=Steinernema carpocapsae TaxID=34508 RepID=A0A4U8UKA6_STECR|nr:hypothetical protein L596_001100 [Steinernema carpocapsae]